MVTIDEIINDIEHPNNRYDERIKYLQKKNLNTSIIQKGVNDVERVIDEGAKSFVIYGEPQSGKTEVMIALTCKLLDKGFRTIFIVMNDIFDDILVFDFTQTHKHWSFESAYNLINMVYFRVVAF